MSPRLTPSFVSAIEPRRSLLSSLSGYSETAVDAIFCFYTTQTRQWPAVRIGVPMKTIQYGNETIECFQEADIKDEKFVEICQQARRLWDRLADEYVAKSGRMGTMVIGAGFTVWYLPPRCRKPRLRMILRSPRKHQASSTWESSRGEIKRFFNGNGIKVQYEWGHAD